MYELSDKNRLYDLTHPSQFQWLVAPIGVALQARSRRAMPGSVAARRRITLAAEAVLHRALSWERAERESRAWRTARRREGRATASFLAGCAIAAAASPATIRSRRSAISKMLRASCQNSDGTGGRPESAAMIA